MSSPSLRSRALPQHGHAVGPGSTTRSRGRCGGKRLARRAFAVEARHLRRFCGGALRGDLILAGGALEFREGQLHLLDEPDAAFRALAVELVRQLGDLQLLMGDQRLIVGGLGLGNREFRLDPRRPGRFLQALLARRRQRRPQCGNVVGQGLGRRHETDYHMLAAVLALSTIG